MKRKRLIRLKVAKGFIQHVDGAAQEEVAEMNLMGLIHQSLLQVVRRNLSGRPKAYFSQEFTVESDASSEGVGAILSQSGHPVAYFSKGLSFSNRLKSAYERKLLAVVLALQKWKHYLMGRHFFLKTDHYTLKYLLEQRVTTTEQQRLLVKLMPYDFTILYRAGKENKGADSLSRQPQQIDLFTLVMPVALGLIDLQKALKVDPHTRMIMETLQSDPKAVPHFSISGHKLYFKDLLEIRPIKTLGDTFQSLKVTTMSTSWSVMRLKKNFAAQGVICRDHKSVLEVEFVTTDGEMWNSFWI
ncbi:Ty3/gypsy retrotransposon protein [Quillaja saponaria]|uniref:Ty3/gypsy retrotransposon protein n=1 Tax=Quillaja saponaria TaxID=32244 RepID=A0AAD7L1B8_QUISA|nr:Ty3/gypsy retrotransposon protein [Quillaja saponaria]